MKELIEKLVFTALGEASMCWSEIPKSVFQSEKAKEIGNRLVDELQALTSVKSESAEEFEEALDKQLDALPYTKHLDDGQYNDGQVAGFERGARWCNDFANADKKQHAISFIKYIDIWHSNRKDISYDDLYEQYIKDYNEYLTTLNNSKAIKEPRALDEQDEEDIDQEPDYYQCMCCGVAQEFSHSCKHCAGPLSEGYF